MNKEQKLWLFIITGFSLAIFLIYFILVAIKNPGIYAFDENVANYFFNHRIRFFDYVFVMISYLGETLALISFCALLLLLPNRKNIGIPVTLITFTSFLINFAIKYMVMRVRPQGLFLTEPTLFYSMPNGYSFPSGHAQQGVVFFMSLSILLSASTKKLWKQSLILSSGTILSVLMCFARVYLCVHFLSDVLCGLSLAIAILSAGFLLREKFTPRHIITIESKDIYLGNKKV